MAFQKVKITEEDIKRIEKLFKEKFTKSENVFSIIIRNEKIKSNISIELIQEENSEFLISLYTNNTHLQLQSCNNIFVSEMLEEVIFISETDDLISGLIVSSQGDCSLYSNVNKKVLRTDFTELNSEKLLSAVALSITESIN